MDRSLRIVHWNAQGLSRKLRLLRVFLSEHKVDVMLISETHLRSSDKCRLPNYHTYRRDEVTEQGQAYRGLAVLVKRNVVHQPLDEARIESFYALGIVVNAAGEELRVFAAYKPPSTRLRVAEVRSLLDSPAPTIIAGDFNCKNRAWNSLRDSPDGRRLLDDAEHHGYDISGPDAPTHIPDNAAHDADVIDIVIHRGLQQPPAQEVLYDLQSDHLPVLLVLSMTPTTVLPPAPRYRYDWTKFSEIMDSNTPSRPVTTPEDAEQLASELTSQIQGAMNSASSTQPARGSQPLPARIQEMISESRRLRKQWQRDRCPTLKTRLNTIANKVTQALSDHAAESWDRHLESIDDEWPSVHRLCKQLANARDPVRPLLARDGTPRYRAADRAEIFAECLEEQFRPNPTQDEEHVQAVEQHLREYFAQPIAAEEAPVVLSPGQVGRMIKKTKVKKAPGADRITNAALRHLPYRSVAALTRLFNGILRTGHFPTLWKTGSVIMLPKPGKNILKPESYRPITLLPTISKVFEKLLLGQLGPHLQPRAEQFGFRAQHSTTLQLTRVLDRMTVASNRKESTVAVFLDMEKAFDRVWHAGLLFKLSKSEAPRRIIKVIASFLADRLFQVAVEGSVSQTRAIRAGVPQGSCLSPVCYACYTDDIPVGRDVDLALYADDAAYISVSMNPTYAAVKMQRTLDLLPEWLSKWRLSVNVGKTQAILIGWKNLPTQLRLNGQAIAWTPTVKYLGVIIDRGLTMKPHVKAVVNKTKVACAKLHPVLRSKLPLRTKLAVYKTYVRSILTYAAPAWYSLASETQRKRLRARENIALRRIVDAPRYVRNSTIQRDLEWESLDEFIGRLAKRMFDRADASSFAHIRDITPHHARPPDGRRPYARALIPAEEDEDDSSQDES